MPGPWPVPEEPGGQQAVLDGMPERLYVCTPTRLSTWLECPRRYRMTYLDRPAPPKGPPWAHNSLGASVHNALAAWWRLPLAERVPAAAGAALERGLIEEGFASAAQSAAQRARARQLVEAYAAGLDPAAEPAGVERTVGLRTRRIAISGRIDRLDERAGPGGTELAVVDYKTGRRALSAEDARSSLALAVYALAAARVLRRPCHRVELHHLPAGQVHAVDHTDAALARHLRRVEDVAAECAAADRLFRQRQAPGEPVTCSDSFPPRPGPGCGWCDYRVRCPEGTAASPPRRPWDGLEAGPAS
ncbi:MAG: PD-(D/E)XK nuclease family protein [Actinobacteria bacterium]|nr:PD-(D/E)XK nuclease family protein [Actinomycetota bacterium]